MLFIPKELSLTLAVPENHKGRFLDSQCPGHNSGPLKSEHRGVGGWEGEGRSTFEN